MHLLDFEVMQAYNNYSKNKIIKYVFETLGYEGITTSLPFLDNQEITTWNKHYGNRVILDNI